MAAVGILLLRSTPLAAQVRCRPCAGAISSDPAAVAAAVRAVAATAAALPEGAALVLKVEHDLAAPAPFDWSPLRAPGLRPLVAVGFATAPPLLQNLPALERELEALAALVRAGPADAAYQIRWQPAGVAQAAGEWSFLIKRASVAISGARPDAQVVTPPLAPGDETAAFLRALYAEDTAAYIDGVALERPDGAALGRFAELLRELDPDAALIADELPANEPPSQVIFAAAELAAEGATLVLHHIDPAAPGAIAPHLLLAREFRGDLSPDPYSSPGGARTVTFVRGEDLGLRMVVERPAGAERVELLLRDPTLTAPVLVDPGSGEERPLVPARRGRAGMQLIVAEAPPFFVLRFDRLSAGEVAGTEEVKERVLVADTRLMPVEEILRRLQAFEDDQKRRLVNYTAVNTMSLRFQLGTGVQTLDATFRGDFFYRSDGSYDWAWQELYVNGVKWRGKRLPEIPLIQPEKAAALPADITFTREYRYRLRGTAQVEGRDCWVVDFEPAVAVAPGRSLYQGTVWVDRAIYARVKTRAVQLGLEGEVTSNDETVYYTPVDARGEIAPWVPASTWLPLRRTGQQIFSILNAATVVEREITLTGVVVNPPDFDARLAAIQGSTATMVRDTPRGLRYLVPDETSGQRVVQEEDDQTRLFLLGGVFYDEAQDFPLPLAGVNWLSFDFRGTGTQTNVFFAGPLLIADLAKPSLFGSKWEGGVDVFALAFAGTDTIFRSGREAIAEDVEALRPNLDLSLGRPLGSFAKVELEYSLGWNKFSRGDDTAPEFVLPEDHLDHQFTLRLRYLRRGFRLRLSGSHTVRSDWQFWGLPGNPEFDPEQESFTTWEAGLGKTWHLKRFQKVGFELQYLGGENLDRFSKYDFGLFSDVTVHGYQTDLVRAEEAAAARLSYGFDLGSVIRVDLVGDAAWATDEGSALEREFLAGVGLVGTFVGPWSTLVNLDLGYAVAGPDDGFTVLLAFLKLFG